MHSDVHPSKRKKRRSSQMRYVNLRQVPFISWLADKNTTEALVQNTQDRAWNRLCKSLWCFHAFIFWAHLLWSMKHMGQTQTLMLRVPSRTETFMVSSSICKASITFLGQQTQGSQGPQGLYKIQTMPHEDSVLKKKKDINSQLMALYTAEEFLVRLALGEKSYLCKKPERINSPCPLRRNI